METAAEYKPNLEIVADTESLAHRCVDFFVNAANKTIKAKNVFYVAISGGHTPKRFFQLLGEMPKAKSLRWDRIQLFWVDERYVPSDSDQSNYKLAADTFLSRVAIPKDNVHRIPTEYDDIKVAAEIYEQTIRDVFGLRESQVPVFDLIILGMGVEGHTGSLFPNSYAPFDTDNFTSVIYSLGDKLNRITLTNPVLCAAIRLAVLVSGEEKADILKRVLTSEPDEVKYPIHTLWSVFDKVIWLVDSAAAKAI
jgi:6-phosphogluconolactonase